MKIGIHHHASTFSDFWIQYCIEKKIAYKIVDCYSSNIIEQLVDCDALMWHWHHADPKAVLFARQLVYSVEASGKIVYPNGKTCWHFDDKVGQKYLLESVRAPTIPTHIYYDKVTALNWVKNADFPKVFKLRGGAGSVNVKLVRSRRNARSLINQAFGKGFSARDSFSSFRDKIMRFKRDKNLASLIFLVKGVGRLVFPTDFQKQTHREKGYVYFQDFMDRNTYDTRVVVIGDKCFTIRRYNREGDFRASGSGRSEYSPDLFDKRCLRIAFDTFEAIGSQSIAFDFIFDENNSPRIVEMSYAFVTRIYSGYWDRNLNWVAGECNCQYLLMDNIVSSINGHQVNQS